MMCGTGCLLAYADNGLLYSIPTPTHPHRSTHSSPVRAALVLLSFCLAYHMAVSPAISALPYHMGTWH